MYMYVYMYIYIYIYLYVYIYIHTCIIKIETHIINDESGWSSHCQVGLMLHLTKQSLALKNSPVKRCTEGICQASCPWHVRSTWYCLAVQILHDWQNIWSDPTHDLKYGYDWQWTWSHSITSNALAAFHKNNRSNVKIFLPFRSCSTSAILWQ